MSPPGLCHWNFSQGHPLDGRPDNRQATHLGGEDINLVGALTNGAEQTLDGVGGADVALHRLGKRVKGQRLVFLLGQTPHGLGIEVSIFGFEGGQLCYGSLLVGLLYWLLSTSVRENRC